MNALIIIDIQHDFLPGGSLAVQGGDEIIPLVNELAQGFDCVVATQDWHPQDHQSFAANHPGKDVYDTIDLNGLPQTLWPVHCVQGSPGAAFAASLDIAPIQKVVRKGLDPEIDSYSGFFDNGHRRKTELDDYLRSRGVTTVYCCGLATDYCVKFTALDALKLGYETVVFADACRGVNIQPDDSAKAFEEIRQAGGKVMMDREWRVKA